MRQKTNEASATIEIDGLESTDLTQLSELLRLAGQIEQESSPTDGLSMDIETPLSNEPEIVDVSVEDDMDDGYLDRLRLLSGQSITESEQFLPELNLDADAEEDLIEEGDKDGIEVYGPFDSVEAATIAAKQETNGIEGENFHVYPEGESFFWKRVMQENVETFEIHPKAVDHPFEPKEYSEGDNPLRQQERMVKVVENDNEDESLEELHESLNRQFADYLKSLK